MLTGGANFAWADETPKALPYTYGFETALDGEGWTTSGLYSSSGINSTYKNSGSKCFLFSGQTKYTQYLISPILTNSTTGVYISFYYIAHAYSAGTRNFSIGYSSTSTEIESFTFTDYSVSVPYYTSETSWTLFNAPCPTGTKYVAIKYTTTTGNLYIDDITIEAQEQYKKPSSFEVSSTTATSARLTWTVGRDETAWQIAYSTKEGFTPNTEGAKVAVTENPYTLSGLTEGVTYYAYVRSNYNGNYSDWSNKIEITPYMDVTINDGNSTNMNVPLYGYKTNYDFKSQIIIPKASLGDIAGRSISQFTLYASQASVNWGAARYNVYLNEVANTTYASTPVFESWGTKVCSNAELSISGNKMVVIFDTPYEYNGGNLMVGFESTATGTSGTSTWYGVSGTNNAAYYYYLTSYTTSCTGFLPKMTIRALSHTVPVTIGENGFTTFACPRALDLTTSNMPDSLTAYRASVDAENSKVRFTSDINQTVVANTGILLKGKANKTYNIPVAASGTPLGSNALLVNSTGGTFDAEDGYTYFAMKKNSSPLTFGTFDPSAVAIPTNKAYLKVILPSGARTLQFVFDDNETTGIKNVDAQKTSNKDIYFNLNGQRVAKPTKGMYISNGKKYIVK